MTHQEIREAIAEIVYDAFPFEAPTTSTPKKPDWISNGNSFSQDRARRAAEAILVLMKAHERISRDEQ